MKIKRILVSQPKPVSEKDPYYDLQTKYGVKLVFRQFIKIEGLSSREFRQTKVPITEHTAVIFTARTAIDHYFRLCTELRFKVPETMKYFCVSEQVAYYLQNYVQYRKRRIFVSPTGKAEDLLPFLQKHSKEKYLFPMSDVHDMKNSIIEQSGVSYTKAVMYRTVSNDFGPDEKISFDMVVLFTPSGVQSLLKNFPDFKNKNILLGAMGSKTIAAIKQEGLRLDITTSPETPSMAAAIDKYLAQEQLREEKMAKEKEAMAKKAAAAKTKKATVKVAKTTPKAGATTKAVAKKVTSTAKKITPAKPAETKAVAKKASTKAAPVKKTATKTTAATKKTAMPKKATAKTATIKKTAAKK